MVGIELAMPHIIHLQILSMEAAQRCPQPAAQRASSRYAKRERPAKGFGIDPFISGERPTLRPEAFLSKSLCLLVLRSSGCAQFSMCSSCRVLAHRTRRGTHFVRNGSVCIGMTHSVASNSPLKPTGHPSDRVGRRRGQRARSRSRVPREVYAGASYLKRGPNLIHEDRHDRDPRAPRRLDDPSLRSDGTAPRRQQRACALRTSGPTEPVEKLRSRRNISRR